MAENNETNEKICEKKAKFKKIMLVSGMYCVLIALFLLSMTTAKFSDTKIAYTSYGAASFNSIILGENNLEDMKAGNVNRFGTPAVGKTIVTENYTPGMSYEGNTAEIFPFSVANGVTEANASEVGVDYTIQLYTTRNLPLKFSLKALADENDETGTIYHTIGATPSQEGDKELKWYEWRFYKTDDSGNEVEPIFSLDGQTLQVSNYQIIIEWPMVASNSQTTNTDNYMKEVELMEVRATVSSKNPTQSSLSAVIDANTGKILYNSNGSEAYGNGIIILRADEGQASTSEAEYDYTIDYRSFRELTDDDGNPINCVPFEVDNGAGKNIAQPYKSTRYQLMLKVPVTADTKDFEYTMQYKDASGYYGGVRDKYFTLNTVPYEYRLYDELYGKDNPTISSPSQSGYNTYTVIPDDQITDELIAEYGVKGSRYKLYKIYTFSTDEYGQFERTLLNNITDPATQQVIPQSAQDEYRLILSDDETALATPGQLSKEAHNVTVFINAVFENDSSSH